MVSGLASIDKFSIEDFSRRQLLILTSLEHSDAAVGVDTRRLPCAADPDIAKLVGPACLIGTFDGDELTDQALPKVQAVLGRLKSRVGRGNEVDGIGHAKDASNIEAGVVLRRRRQGVDSNDKRFYSVAAGSDDNVGRLAELC